MLEFKLAYIRLFSRAYMNSQGITWNYTRGKEVAKAAIAMKTLGGYPFNLPGVFPDAIIPEGVNAGSLEHALFLFYACNFDSSQRATVVYEEMRNLTKRVDFKEFPKLDEDKLYEIFKESMKKMGDPKKTRLNPLAVVLQNAKKLQTEYDGDPRNIFEENIKDTLQALQYGRDKKANGKFMQYGLGKAALVMKNFVRFGMWPFSPYEIPIKIDRHLLRISVGAGVLEIPDMLSRARIDRVVGMLTRGYQRVTSREKISAVDLNDAFWAIGSYVCTQNDDINCHLACGLGCDSRPRIDERLTWYYPGSETRTDVNNLFRWAKQNNS